MQSVRRHSSRQTMGGVSFGWLALLAVWQSSILTYWTRLIHERLPIPNQTLTGTEDLRWPESQAARHCPGLVCDLFGTSKRGITGSGTGNRTRVFRLRT